MNSISATLAPPTVTTPSTPSRTDRRLQKKLPPGELLQYWSRAWVSRDGRLHTVFAARTLDYVVLTDRHLYLFSTGFFTRRPRRRVFAQPLDRLQVTQRKADDPLRLRVMVPRRKPLLFDLRRGERSDAMSAMLLSIEPARPGTVPPPGPAPGPSPAPPTPPA